jgi:hypothetical protein
MNKPNKRIYTAVIVRCEVRTCMSPAENSMAVAAKTSRGIFYVEREADTTIGEEPVWWRFCRFADKWKPVQPLRPRTTTSTTLSGHVPTMKENVATQTVEENTTW